ncbi:hypothetical protein [Streptomyces sp. NPDC001315]|uniref:hypothetical protein n=1 Tax=Streptomyces sp. NPDC001315 TaxID=3364562 RepID=UPI0036995833
MGIRMLHRRTGPDRARPHGQSSAQADSKSKAVTGAGLPAVPAFAVGAAVARIPTTTAMALSRAARELRRGLARRERSATAARETPAWRQWAVTGRGHLDLLLARLPRRRRTARTVTVFVATPVRLRRPPDGRARG